TAFAGGHGNPSKIRPVVRPVSQISARVAIYIAVSNESIAAVGLKVLGCIVILAAGVQDENFVGGDIGRLLRNTAFQTGIQYGSVGGGIGHNHGKDKPRMTRERVPPIDCFYSLDSDMVAH